MIQMAINHHFIFSNPKKSLRYTCLNIVQKINQKAKTIINNLNKKKRMINLASNNRNQRKRRKRNQID